MTERLTAEELDKAAAILDPFNPIATASQIRYMYDCYPVLIAMARESIALRAALADTQTVLEDIERTVVVDAPAVAMRTAVRALAVRGLDRMAEALGGERRGE